MTQRHEHIDLLLDELERYGLRGEVADRGKHLEVAWQTPHGRRFVITARTPSDWRAGLNTRSTLRKLLRADNLQLKQVSELTFQKAMSLPKQGISRELVLQNDVAALTDLVFEMHQQIAALQEQNAALNDRMNSITIVSRIEFASPDDGASIARLADEETTQSSPFRQGSTQAKIFACLTYQFKLFSDILKEAGIDKKYVASTLSKAKRLGYAENGLRGMWRRK